MNGIVSNSRYISLSKVDDVQYNGSSIVDENKIVELAPIISKIIEDLENTFIQASYTKEEVNNLIANRAGFEIVDALPIKDISPNKIYLLKLVTDNNENDNDAYDEFIYINDTWEHVGSFQVDFSNYYNRQEIVSLLNDTLEALNTEFEAVKQGYEDLKIHVGAIDDVLDAINGEVV